MTWNIAGIRARLETLTKWLKKFEPDVVCLQEIKTISENFPRQAIEDLGYHLAIYGQKSFNGVAILSKFPFEEIQYGFEDEIEDPQARFIEATISWQNKILRIACLYLPNGNPVDTPKYPYKLEWMERLYQFTKKRLLLEEPLILAGDFNVIAQPIDAKNLEQWKEDALYLPQTRQAFYRLCHLGLSDAIRSVTDEPCFTFWDFQNGAWRKNNGIRIDYFLLSAQASDLLKHAYVQKDVRDWEKPSDHVPVWIELKA